MENGDNFFPLKYVRSTQNLQATEKALSYSPASLVVTSNINCLSAMTIKPERGTWVNI